MEEGTRRRMCWERNRGGEGMAGACCPAAHPFFQEKFKALKAIVPKEQCVNVAFRVRGAPL